MENNLSKGKRSFIWKFYTPVSGTKAKCNFCKKNMCYKSSITNLRQHLVKKHPSIKLHDRKIPNAQMKNTIIEKSEITFLPQNNDTTTVFCSDTRNSQSQPSTSTSSTSCSSSITIHESTSVLNRQNLFQAAPKLTRNVRFTQKEIFDDKLLALITNDFQPLSIVENEGFRQFIHTLNPSYTLPSRNTMTSLLSEKFDETKIATLECISTSKSVTVTTDCWTSVNNESFIVVTAHYITNDFVVKSLILEVAPILEVGPMNHASVNFAKELKRITDDWGIARKILIAVSPNANIKKAISELQWEHFGCLARTINVIVISALESVSLLITNVSHIVSHFERSTISEDKLDFYQKRNSKNSVYYMLKKMTEVKDQINATSADLVKKEWPSMLSDQNFVYVEELIEILEPIESASKSMSSEKEATLSSVIVIVNGIQDLYKSLSHDNKFSDQCKVVLRSMLDGINLRFKNVESNLTLRFSTFLDPRFKEIGFSDEGAAKRAKSQIINALTVLIETEQTNAEMNKTVTEPATEIQLSFTPSSKKQNLWATFDNKATKVGVSSFNSRSRAIIEVQRYLEIPLLSRNENPLDWWKHNDYNFPYLGELVKTKFGTVSTSVSCDRVFDKMGQLLSEHQSRLPSEKFKQIMFINQNSSM